MNFNLLAGKLQSCGQPDQDDSQSDQIQTKTNQKGGSRKHSSQSASVCVKGVRQRGVERPKKRRKKKKKEKKRKKRREKKEKRKKERPGGQRVSELVAAEAKLPAGDDDHDFNVDHVYLQDKIVPSIMASVACS